jgi:hypothetical protein
MQMGGILLLNKANQFIARNEMAQTLRKNEKPYEHIKLTVTEFNKVRINKKEIQLEGRLYDIKKSTTNGEIVSLIVVNDEKEQRIINRIKDLIPYGHKSSPQQLSKIFDQLLSLVYLPTTECEIPLFSSHHLKAITYLRITLRSETLNIPSPPPWLA